MVNWRWRGDATSEARRSTKTIARTETRVSVDANGALTVPYLYRETVSDLARGETDCGLVGAAFNMPTFDDVSALIQPDQSISVH